MEAQTDIQTYMEQGRQGLAQGQGRDAAIAFAHAAQIAPNNPAVHLGLAEANLALNAYHIVKMACDRVLELEPQGGTEAEMARALEDLLEKRYESAMQHLDVVIEQDPANAYAHAFRSYLFRLMGQTYDSGLARARAARISYGGRFDGAFPPVEEPGRTDPVSQTANDATKAQAEIASPGLQAQTTDDARWSRPDNQMQRRVVRTRFALSRYPNLVTNVLIGLNVLIYLLVGLAGGDLLDPTHSPLFAAGVQYGPLVAQGEVWRIFTAMFLHLNLLHLGVNMLSLYFIGVGVELIYGKWRYLAIYLGSGIIGGVITNFLEPGIAAAGASGAIFGVFGAIGVFYIVNRNSLGTMGRSAITNWLFWLGLNLFIGFSSPGIGIVDHIAGLASGMLLSLLLLPRGRRIMF